MPTVHVNGKPFSANTNETLSAFFLRHRLAHPHPCGMQGRCRACRIRARGQLSPPNEKEASALSPAQLESGFRLACQTRILGDACVELPLLQSTPLTLDGEVARQNAPSGDLGLAVDIGTTTLAFALVDLVSGNILESTVSYNPQIAFGQDVLTRISHTDLHPNDLFLMQKTVVNEIEKAATALCLAANRHAKAITRMVCVGNTVMLHYLAAADPSPIGRFPYTPATLFDREYSAADLGFSLLSAASIYIPPCISGFIGADVTAGLLLISKEAPFIFADLGTNGEIAAFSKKDGYLFTSAAAGPAFEGGGISCGMPAAEGAVSGARRNENGWDLTVIGKTAPQGICGSGLLDTAAALLVEGRLTEEGRLIQKGDKTDPVTIVGGEAVCLLTDTVFLTQKDIYRLLLAKAAIAAAIDTVYSHLPTDTLYVCGSFGTHMKLDSALRIGLFGSHGYKTVKPMGNTALGGAVTLLTDPDLRTRFADRFKPHRLLENGGDPTFNALFTEHLTFSTERM